MKEDQIQVVLIVLKALAVWMVAVAAYWFLLR